MTGPPNPAASSAFCRVRVDGGSDAEMRPLAEEVPVAIEFNGIGYAVLMASPERLEDLGYGFARTERVIDSASDVLHSDLHWTDRGAVLRMSLSEDAATRVLDRVRHRTTDSSCGLCGIENLDQALRPLPHVPTPWDGEDAAVFRAASSLSGAQPLNARTHAVHAAAVCSRDGEILAVREDVGRHNAFDKLIGHMLRQDLDWEGGFALLTSRCSYELVEKAALSRCPMLATISAPTHLAVARAAEAGLALRTLVRSDALLRPVSTR